MDLNGSKRNYCEFLACHFLGHSVLQNNISNDMTISNMLTNGADNSSCSIVSEHNALNILNKKKMYFLAWRCCFLFVIGVI